MGAQLLQRLERHADQPRALLLALLLDRADLLARAVRYALDLEVRILQRARHVVDFALHALQGGADGAQPRDEAAGQLGELQAAALRCGSQQLELVCAVGGVRTGLVFLIERGLVEGAKRRRDARGPSRGGGGAVAGVRRAKGRGRGRGRGRRRSALGKRPRAHDLARHRRRRRALSAGAMSGACLGAPRLEPWMAAPRARCRSRRRHGRCWRVARHWFSGRGVRVCRRQRSPLAALQGMADGGDGVGMERSYAVECRTQHAQLSAVQLLRRQLLADAPQLLLQRQYAALRLPQRAAFALLGLPEPLKLGPGRFEALHELVDRLREGLVLIHRDVEVFERVRQRSLRQADLLLQRANVRAHRLVAARHGPGRCKPLLQTGQLGAEDPDSQPAVRRCGLEQPLGTDELAAHQLALEQQAQVLRL